MSDYFDLEFGKSFDDSSGQKWMVIERLSTQGLCLAAKWEDESPAMTYLVQDPEAYETWKKLSGRFL